MLNIENIGQTVNLHCHYPTVILWQEIWASAYETRESL